VLNIQYSGYRIESGTGPAGMPVGIEWELFTKPTFLAETLCVPLFGLKGSVRGLDQRLHAEPFGR
jgi:hypothetical protein